MTEIALPKPPNCTLSNLRERIAPTQPLMPNPRSHLGQPDPKQQEPHLQQEDVQKGSYG